LDLKVLGAALSLGEEVGEGLEFFAEVGVLLVLGLGDFGYAAGEVGDFFGELARPKAAGNLTSRRISEKTGMRIVATEERNFVSGRLPCEIWEITANEWRKARALLRARQQR
jgi:hypothetical protein